MPEERIGPPFNSRPIVPDPTVPGVYEMPYPVPRPRATEPPTDSRPYVIRVAVYEGDAEHWFDVIAKAMPDDGTVLVSGRFEDEADDEQ